MKSASLNRRLVVGAALWTSGVLIAAIVIAVTIATRYPRSSRLVHDGLLALCGAALVTAGVSVIRRGLSPFHLLHARLAAVRDGRTNRLEGDYPAEVEPLVADLNALLEDRERRVARAMARAGDLAHGLKTPLAILSHEIDRADAAGQHDLALLLGQQVARMRRQLEGHLAQARAEAAGHVGAAPRTRLVDATEGLVRAIGRLYVDRGLVITDEVPGDVIACVPLEDLEEMIGNLLDNACKWAHSRVLLTVTPRAARVVVLVDDDGKGLSAAMRAQVLGRGVRADESAPGSGLGLAIVHDLATAYGGAMALHDSPLGGLRVELNLPAA